MTTTERTIKLIELSSLITIMTDNKNDELINVISEIVNDILTQHKKREIAALNPFFDIKQECTLELLDVVQEYIRLML